MNGRQLFAALASVAIAPDELWTPAQTIFLPPKGGWLARNGLIIDQMNSITLAYDAEQALWKAVSPRELAATRAYFQPREVVKLVNLGPYELTVLAPRH